MTAQRAKKTMEEIFVGLNDSENDILDTLTGFESELSKYTDNVTAMFTELVRSLLPASQTNKQTLCFVTNHPFLSRH